MDTTGRRRLCLFCETWASGGIESFLFNVLTHADLTSLEIDLVAARMADSVFTQPLADLGIQFVELSGNTRKVKENRRLFRELLERRHYAVVHLNLFQGLSLAYAKLAAQAGVPVRIAHSHNAGLRKSPARPLKLALHRWGRWRYGRYATHRWACSGLAAQFLFGAQSFQFIPNGVDAARFSFDLQVRRQIRQELGLGDALVVGHVGRLCPQKNQSFLLDVFARLHRQQPNSVLLLVGEGEDRPALEAKAKSLGLETAVLFYGASHQVEELYWAMDCLVMPSLFEGLPVTAVEAQAAGLPCLLSQCVTRECALTGQTVFLPLDAGVQTWSETVLELISPADRAAAGDTVAAAGFDIHTVAERIRETWME